MITLCLNLQKVVIDMKKLKKFDLIIFIAFFISVCCLTVTVVVQQNIKKEILKINNQPADYVDGHKIIDTSQENQGQTQTTGVSDNLSQSNDNSDYEIDNITYSQITNKSVNDSLPTVLNSGNINATQSVSKPTTTKPTTTKVTTTEKCTELDSVLILNTNSKKIHSSTCSYALKIKEENKLVISSNELQNYLNDEYVMCSVCHGYKE